MGSEMCIRDRAGSLAGDRLLQSMLYGTSPVSPPVLAAASLLMLAAGLLAAYLPARHAASVDPMQALRME